MSARPTLSNKRATSSSKSRRIIIIIPRPQTLSSHQCFAGALAQEEEEEENCLVFFVDLFVFPFASIYSCVSPGHPRALALGVLDITA